MRRGTPFLAVPLALLLAVLPSAPAADAPPAGPKPQQNLDLTILDPGSRPLPGAKLKLRHDAGESTLTTDANGRATLSFPADTRYLSASVDAPGFVPVALSFTPARSKEPLPAAYTLTLEPGTTIGGRVLDDTGAPVPGATVVLSVRRTNKERPHERLSISYVDTKTDADGRWTYTRAPRKFDSVSVGTYHHKYATGAFYPMPDFKDVAALRDRSATLRLARGVPVKGVVYDSAGKPLAGAAIGLGADRVPSNAVPEFKTDENGRFAFGAIPNEMTVVTVKARGHAPDQKKFLIATDPPKDLEFRLEPAKTLRGRVVDAAGKPIKGVTLYTDTWRSTRTLDTRFETDAEGRFTWPQAPADQVLLDIYKSGYADLRNHPVTASDREITLTLRKPLTVVGRVIDAQTKKPVETFNVIQGISFDDGRVSWQRRDRPDQAIKPANGAFQYELTYPYPGFAARVEADGYLPADSRIFRMDEQRVELTFELKKGAPLAGVVRTADGQPAPAAKLVIATPDQTAYIANGSEIRDQGCVTATADPAGRYTLPPQTGVYTLVVIHDAGYAELPSAKITPPATADVTLTPWARVEGVVKIGKQSGAKAEMRLNYRDDSTGERGVPRIYHQVETTADEQGRFTFDRVRAGEVTVARTIRTPMSGSSWMVSNAAYEKLTATPGQTARVQVGGTGRTLVGRVEIPEEVRKNDGWRFERTSLVTKRDAPKLEIPDDVQDKDPAERQKWYQEFLKSDAGKAYKDALDKANDQTRYFSLPMKPDGTFRADDVPPGTYSLSIAVAKPQPDGTCGPGDILATAAAEVTVDDAKTDAPVEIPAMKMTMRRTVGVGAVAPNFSAKTLDGKPLALADFKGRYVLLDFWATWCGPCVEETPHLKSAYDLIKDDPRFAMVSLSLDEKPELPKKFAEKHNTPWTQGFLGEWSKTDVPASYGVNGIPSIWLIGPDGKVIARDLRGDRIRAALESARSTAR